MTLSVYSKELQLTLDQPMSNVEILICQKLQILLSKQFENPNLTKHWREGTTKSSFNYLLLDPQITINLPERSKMLTQSDTWNIFLSSIFYIGKGKCSRPLDHLYQTMKANVNKLNGAVNKKIGHILNIWQNKLGVICLQVFNNCIAVDAYTREAAMISAINVRNLENVNVGVFYGHATTWTEQEKNLFGTYLLKKAMNIYLHEGERQIRPSDL